MGNYHDWSEEDFDWKALNDAADYIEKNCRRWARFGVWTKEKYGTLRISTTCAYLDEYGFISHLFYPGYVRYMFPLWFRRYVDRPFGKVLTFTGILGLIQRYQTWVLKHFWRKAAKKWPHVAEEILDEYDWMVGDES